MDEKLKAVITDLWHLSKIALATGDTSRHSRMIYVKYTIQMHYKDLIVGLSNKQLWLKIEKTLTQEF